MNDLAEAICSTLFPDDFSVFLLNARDERVSIENFLDSEARPVVYGFTTLFGHLDHIPADQTSQSRLLKAHLIGPVETLPGEWAEILLRVKVANLAQGGSGLHPHTFEALTGAISSLSQDPQSLGAWSGNWLSSYGSGDVVPGAWLVQQLSSKVNIQLSHPGDLIALINGHFVSSTAALLNAVRFLVLAQETLSAMSDCFQSLHTSTQLPVTLRDIAPLRETIEITQVQLFEAIHARVNSPSANPLFSFTSGEVTAVSQSSFLDFSLTGAIAQAIQTVAQACVYLKASVQHAGRLEAESSSMRIQNVKIIEDHIREIASLVIPTNFSFSESNGVEDIGDQSLRSARMLGRTLSQLDMILSLHSEATGRARSEAVLSVEFAKIYVAAQKSAATLDF